VGAIHLIRGDDEALVSAAVRAAVDELLGDGDRDLMLSEFGGDDVAIVDALDAAATMPFLTDRRVVVVRDLHNLATAELELLIGYCADPPPWAALVLAGVGGKVPKKVLDALKAAGAIIVAPDPPTKASDRSEWIAEHIGARDIRIDAPGRSLIADTFGQDLGRLGGLLDTLESSFPQGAKLTAADVAPFLGDGGDVPPWELTDAIDRGDTAVALQRMRRMLEAGERHPLQLMATLHAHYVRMLKLDGLDGLDERSAAAVLGLKGSTFPARKALDQSRRLGHEGVRKAVGYLAEADLDLRGAKDWDPVMVMELLVARLSKVGGGRRR
jgi:DNA polymerase III subunit delta